MEQHENTLPLFADHPHPFQESCSLKLSLKKEPLQKAHKRSQESDYVDLLHRANVPHVVEGWCRKVQEDRLQSANQRQARKPACPAARTMTRPGLCNQNSSKLKKKLIWGKIITWEKINSGGKNHKYPRKGISGSAARESQRKQKGVCLGCSL